MSGPLNVWTYWAGPMPRWIGVCLDSFRRCCKASKLHVLTPDTVPELPISSRWRDLPPGTGTDCLRAALLATYGGLWADADTVCVADPAELFNARHDRAQFLYMRWPRSGRAIAGYVYAPKGHPAACRWMDGCDSALRHGGTVGWGQLGEVLLSAVLPGCEPAWEMSLATFLPIDIDADPYRYFRYTTGHRDYATQDTVCYGLNHSWMMAHKQATMDAFDAPGGRALVQHLLSDAMRSNARAK